MVLFGDSAVQRSLSVIIVKKRGCDIFNESRPAIEGQPGRRYKAQKAGRHLEKFADSETVEA